MFSSRLSLVLFSLLLCCGICSPNVYAAPERPETITEAEVLDVAFLKNDFLYCIRRKGDRFSESNGKAAEWSLTMYKLPLNAMTNKDLRDNDCLSVLKDGIGLIGPRSFLRWRLYSKSIWGTQRTLDDDHSGIFDIPFNDIRQLEERIRRKGISTSGLQNFWGGDILISKVCGGYWASRRVYHSAMATIAGENGWPVGSRGIYFDFIPNDGDETIMLFILFEKECIKHSESRNLSLTSSLIEAWFCTNRTDPTKNTTIPLPPIKKVTIATDLNEPFYAFERNGNYYFTALSGRIFVASLIPVDAKAVEHLIGQLDDDVFATREKAMHALRSIGKPAQSLLETHSSNAKSAEQKRRINQVVGALRLLPDRETQLLWKDEKRPVAKLLFDQDKNKVYAFTKPNKEKQVYFFEIADKPQARLFTGNIAPDSPASLPASTRVFLEYARFVRKLK